MTDVEVKLSPERSGRKQVLACFRSGIILMTLHSLCTQASIGFFYSSSDRKTLHSFNFGKRPDPSRTEAVILKLTFMFTAKKKHQSFSQG